MDQDQPTPAIGVLCVDDHRIVREGIELILHRTPDIRVVASVATGEEAIAQYRRQRSDIVLMDLRLRTVSGLDAIRAIRQHDPQAKVIVLTMYDGDEHIFQAIGAGAATYLMKDMLADDLVRVIRDVHHGRQRPMDADIRAKLNVREGHEPLSPRELQVIQSLAEGKRNKEIADTLGISEQTVAAHLKSIYHKLHVNDRTAALTAAIRRGIVNW
jgi:DNA-binding NarL/FixJ family response regulator